MKMFKRRLSDHNVNFGFCSVEFVENQLLGFLQTFQTSCDGKY
jgi:hypothetical protein